MKKVIFLVIAAAAALTACSKSEVVDSTVMNQVIAFDNYVGKDAQTKASVVEGVTSVNVNAWLHPVTPAEGASFTSNFMENQPITRTSAEASDWDYNPKKYWPAVDQEVDFVAWVPVNNATVKDATLTFKVPTDVRSQTDLIVANPVLKQNRADNNSPVNLSFHHLLSRIAFEINATGVPGPEDQTTVVKLNNVTLTGKFASSGTVNMADPVAEENGAKILADAEPGEVSYTLTGTHFGWANPNLTEGETDTKIDIIRQGRSNNTADSYIMLIPDKNVPTKINVTYTVTTYTDEIGEDGKPTGNKIESGEPIRNTADFLLTQPYKAGKAYKYIFNISMQAISFSVEVEDWTSTDNTETSVTLTPGTTQGA